MPKCTAEQIGFGRLGRRIVEANFEGSALSSDGGLMLLRQVDRRTGLSKAVAAALHDPRNLFFITHELRDLVAQRLLRCAADTKTSTTIRPCATIR